MCLAVSCTLTNLFSWCNLQLLAYVLDSQLQQLYYYKDCEKFQAARGTTHTELSRTSYSTGRPATASSVHSPLLSTAVMAESEPREMTHLGKHTTTQPHTEYQQRNNSLSVKTPCVPDACMQHTYTQSQACLLRSACGQHTPVGSLHALNLKASAAAGPGCFCSLAAVAAASAGSSLPGNYCRRSRCMCLQHVMREGTTGG
jgi:hypothetical protein